MPANTAAALSYVLGLITGVLFLVLAHGNSYVKFHATQSVVLSVAWLGGWIVLTIIPVIGWVLLPFWGLLMFVLWLVSIVKAWQGEMFKLPVLGQYAEQLAKKA
ncbi:MAG: DUF4870 domain-containing protein [Candidatus Chisholmbacteria bacterium]|nr:DUF4870 domain-containing protein [Candidatus Chisholmbacteria bacterium]